MLAFVTAGAATEKTEGAVPPLEAAIASALKNTLVRHQQLRHMRADVAIHMKTTLENVSEAMRLSDARHSARSSSKRTSDRRPSLVRKSSSLVNVLANRLSTSDRYAVMEEAGLAEALVASPRRAVFTDSFQRRTVELHKRSADVRVGLTFDALVTTSKTKAGALVERVVGVVVAEVGDDSLAKSRVRAGDVVHAVNGSPVSCPGAAAILVRETTGTVVLDVSWGGAGATR